ncbi:MAG: acetyl-CoA C-acetyltransferase [Gemmatimonadota bacterium]|nr:acetyl-CoA C-acyltransferase [Gemmatimonadota bacterium]MDP6529923.1 acetyl-CoA C-acetyltransferase [Gemmatimonadota bacterium]MDP6802160.1 acetyl-CoA C-acetyltransferase [Gemmatimonadota bacterium]MDP7032799.1 acetyl-CoA C-acetyltransferase [Gemmatimonadota bacterium]
MRPVAILSAVRTPIGRFLGSLAEVSACDLGITASREAIRRAGVSQADIGETIFGMARQAGSGPNPARQISMGAGVPETACAFTVNKACASGLKSVTLAASAILEGEARFVLAGGAESMTRVPHYLTQARNGYRLGHAEIVDGMYLDGFHCPIADQLMGATAETIAEQLGLTRTEQDEYALQSQTRAAAARDAGRFDDERVPVTIPGRRGETHEFTQDEHLRPDTTLEKLARLPAVFRKGGTVHAGNSSGITDGAAALVLADARDAQRAGTPPLGWIVGWASAGVGAEVMGLGPIPSIRRLLDRTGWKLADVDLIELNEAFAAQVLAVVRELQIDPERMNVNGGAIALGHPIGATGARILATLLHEMRRRGAARGIATLCVSGGMGYSVAVTREKP